MILMTLSGIISRKKISSYLLCLLLLNVKFTEGKKTPQELHVIKGLQTHRRCSSKKVLTFTLTTTSSKKYNENERASDFIHWRKNNIRFSIGTRIFFPSFVVWCVGIQLVSSALQCLQRKKQPLTEALLKARIIYRLQKPLKLRRWISSFMSASALFLSGIFLSGLLFQVLNTSTKEKLPIVSICQQQFLWVKTTLKHEQENKWIQDKQCSASYMVIRKVLRCSIKKSC